MRSKVMVPGVKVMELAMTIRARSDLSLVLKWTTLGVASPRRTAFNTPKLETYIDQIRYSMKKTACKGLGMKDLREASYSAMNTSWVRAAITIDPAAPATRE